MNPQLIAPRSFTRTALIDDSGLQDIGTPVYLNGAYSRLCFVLSNLGPTKAFADVALLVQLVKDGTWFTYISGSSWDLDLAIKLYVSDEGLATLAADGEIMAFITLPPVYAIKFQANGATGADDLGVSIEMEVAKD